MNVATLSLHPYLVCLLFSLMITTSQADLELRNCCLSYLLIIQRPLQCTVIATSLECQLTRVVNAHAYVFFFERGEERDSLRPFSQLCTYARWFARPDRVNTEPYYELPLPVTKLRSMFRFRVGAHSLPIEQGNIEVPQVPRHLRRCTFCATNAIGDERHCVFDCPHFQGLRQRHAQTFQDSRSWHAVPLPWSGWGGCCRPTNLQVHFVLPACSWG